MKSECKLVVLVISFIALLCACGAGETTPPVNITLTPPTANVPVRESVQFTASVLNSTNRAVSWSLSGTGCNATACGTISSTGLYTAPAYVPSPAIVTVKATSAADRSKSATAKITIMEAIEWTWVSGSDTAYQSGIYGIQGTAAATNVPGGRLQAVSWLDPWGNLWLFGGIGYDSAGDEGELNDLWKYDPTTLEWTWMSGSPIRYQPGNYGTKGVGAPSNVPGARYVAISWVDSSGNLWLFGGIGYDSAGNYGELNDVWTYDLNSSEWTWVSGSTIRDQLSTYGTKGTADPSNDPGGRGAAVSWFDSGGNLWLFGGMGYDSAVPGNLNDLWKFDPTTLAWTWVSGSSTHDQAGIYGTKGVADPSNIPGARQLPATWLDTQGKLWLFGGDGCDSIPWYGVLNDLWKFDPTTLEWAWISGSNSLTHPGIYGTKGIADPLNIAGARYAAASWLDSQGRFWLFGGVGMDATANGGHLNDLWHYTR